MSDVYWLVCRVEALEKRLEYLTSTVWQHRTDQDAETRLTRENIERAVGILVPRTKLCNIETGLMEFVCHDDPPKMFLTRLQSKLSAAYTDGDCPVLLEFSKFEHSAFEERLRVWYRVAGDEE